VTEAPKIQFPQPRYPIKVIAQSHDQLREQLIAVVKRHDPEFDESNVELVHSRQRSYCSARMVICATGEPQLKALHEELQLNPLVKMVL